MIKVAFLLGSLNRGGTETHSLNSFKNMDSAPFKMIGIYRKNGDLTQNFNSTQVPLFHLSPSSLFDISYFIKLRKVIKKEQIQIVHAQQPIEALYAKIACWGMKTKIILALHGFDFKINNKSKRILKYIIKTSALNLYVSNYLKSYYSNKFKLNSQKQICVYNGVEKNILEPENKVASHDYRKEFSVKENESLLVSVGSFISGRNQLLICKALHKLDEKKAPFVFLFIGRKDKNEPQLYDACYNYCKEKNLLHKVHFLGLRSDVPNILKNADAFIYSTNHDTFSLSLVEAIVAEIPVFVNDWEVMTEITENGKLANLYKSNDAEDLVKQIEYYLINPNEYKNRAIENSKLASQKYSISEYHKKLNEVYQKLVN